MVFRFWVVYPCDVSVDIAKENMQKTILILREELLAKFAFENMEPGQNSSAAVLTLVCKGKLICS